MPEHELTALGSLRELADLMGAGVVKPMMLIFNANQARSISVECDGESLTCY
jgi:hypothetical protein